MGLDSALLIASGGLDAVNQQLALISQNIANANTAGYTTETAPQQSVAVGGQGMGVRVGPTQLALNAQVNSDILAQSAVVSNLQTQQSTLQTIDPVLGQVAQGNDLSSLLGQVQNGFSTLLNDPSSVAQQQSVVNAATTFANSVNALSTAYTTARQGVQNDLVASVASMNQALASIGSLSSQIIAQQAAGQSTADLQQQRNQAMQSLASLTSVVFLPQANGDMLVVTSSGLQLPTRGGSAPFSIAGATMSPSVVAGPGIMQDGQDVTTQFSGGQIGADLLLRNTTLPTDQAQLDEYAQTVATRFAGQGLQLFTDPTGAVPSGGGTPVQAGYVGFSAEMQVNPAILATPSLVRDGTQAVAGSATGATAFTPNPSGGPAGFSTLISRVLNFALGTEVQQGVAQPAENTLGLGPGGNLSAGYSGTGSLASLATSLVATQSQASATVTSTLAQEQSVQTALAGKATGTVNIDSELSQMIALENSYGANAKIITTIQSLQTTLLDSIT